jgi:hypothetical protein
LQKFKEEKQKIKMIKSKKKAIPGADLDRP